MKRKSPFEATLVLVAIRHRGRWTDDETYGRVRAALMAKLPKGIDWATAPYEVDPAPKDEKVG